MSDKISDVIKKLTGTTVVEITERKETTQNDYFIEYGIAKERIRIIDLLVNSNLDNDTIVEVTNLIRETK